jgi:glutathione synthase/RimK-type ligase-like ATP-grasp enzyme
MLKRCRRRYEFMDISVLVLGDTSDWEAYNRVCRCLQNQHHLKKMNWVTCTYDHLEKNKLPLINSNVIIIYLFFPFAYWDKHIEKQGYRNVYGNVDFYSQFRFFWSQIHRILKNKYRGKKIYFINHPLKIANDRDKEFTKTILTENDIKTPTAYHTRDYQNILNLIEEKNKKLFLKVRYGSMGKGITYMEKGYWKSNLKFEDGKIINPCSDYGWTFTDITNNVQFLKVILTKDIVIEEMVESYEIEEDMIFDLRLYIFNDTVLYILPRTNNKDAITTNISQGGIGRTTKFLEEIPKDIINKVIETGVKTMEAMEVNFAGVDIMISKDSRIYVIELNAFPGFPKENKFNLSKRLIQLIEDKKWGWSQVSQ